MTDRIQPLPVVRPHYDPQGFGRFSEAIARTMGTARFLFIQSLIVVTWIAINIAAAALRFDPYPFILLNLAFSTQAAYAAPLILLAQSRQAERDKIEFEEDKATNVHTAAEDDWQSEALLAIAARLGVMLAPHPSPS